MLKYFTCVILILSSFLFSCSHKKSIYDASNYPDYSKKGDKKDSKEQDNQDSQDKSKKKSKKYKQSKPYQIDGIWYYPLAEADIKDFQEYGVASWYGPDFNGKKTSNGEIYNMYGISAAHKTLPFDIYVRVYNLSNNKKIDVRINDRGPFVSGRIIDLSYGAAKELGVFGPGTTQVKIEALGKLEIEETQFGPVKKYTPVDYYVGNFTVQIGAFSNLSNAEKLKTKLEAFYKDIHIEPYNSRNSNVLLYRVLVGKYKDLESCQEHEKTLKLDGFKDAFTISE